MNWFLIGTLAPFIYGTTNYIDKFVVEKYYKGIKIGYIVLSFTFLSSLLSPLIYLLAEDIAGFSVFEILMLFSSGVLSITALLPYMQSLKARDTSLIVPIFQLIPIFVLFLGLLFLDEKVSLDQLLLGLVIIACAVGISLDLNKGIKVLKIDYRTLIFMVFSCFLYALSNLTFKVGAGDHEFWSAVFWLQIGFGIQFILISLIFKKARREAIELIKEFKGKLICISIINTFLDATARIVYNFALVSAPLFIASIVNSFQPVFVFLMGIILTLWMPQFIKENLSKKILLQKLIFILIIFLSAIAFNYSLK